MSGNRLKDKMGLRERMNQRPGLAAGVVALLVFVAVGTVVMQVFANRRSISELPDVYFSDDDGHTYFAAKSTNAPPFEHQGKQAVRAYVFECKSGQRFVGYLDKYNPEAHKLVLAGKGNAQTEIAGRLLKKPKDAVWAKSDDQRAVAKVATVSCADGSEPNPIEP